MNWHWKVRLIGKTGQYNICQLPTGRNLSEIDAFQDFYLRLTGCKMLLEGMSEREYPDIPLISHSFQVLWRSAFD